MAKGTLPLRAAEYFGVEGEPRMGILLRRGVYALVLKRHGQRVLLIYNESRVRASSEYLTLSDAAYRSLLAALKAVA